MLTISGTIMYMFNKLTISVNMFVLNMHFSSTSEEFKGMNERPEAIKLITMLIFN